jgi:hypothetical protein
MVGKLEATLEGPLGDALVEPCRRCCSPLVALHRGGAKNDSLLGFPKARGRVARSHADGAASSRIVLMLVKKPSNQLLQLELTGRVIHSSGILKELPLDFSRKDHSTA